jgi:hypothetical protein
MRGPLAANCAKLSSSAGWTAEGEPFWLVLEPPCNKLRGPVTCRSYPCAVSGLSMQSDCLSLCIEHAPHGRLSDLHLGASPVDDPNRERRTQSIVSRLELTGTRDIHLVAPWRVAAWVTAVAQALSTFAATPGRRGSGGRRGVEPACSAHLSFCLKAA